MSSGVDFLMNLEARIKGATQAVSEIQSMRSAVDDAKAGYASLEKASAGAAKGLEKVASQIESQKAKIQAAQEAGNTDAVEAGTKKLADLVTKENELKKAAEGAKTALDKQGKELDELAGGYIKLSKAEKDAADKAERTKSRVEGFKKMGGPIGAIATRVGDFREGVDFLSKSMSRGSATAIMAGGAIATVAVALAAVAVAAVAAGAAFALSQANAQRDMKLTLQAMTGTAEGARHLHDAFGEITQATGVGSDRLLALTRDLQKAKVSAEDMPAALRAIAMQEAALGDQGGTADLIKSLEDGKTSASDMAAEMESKFGGVVDQKMLGFDQQLARLQQNVADLFSGLSIENFLKGLSKLVDLFDVSTESGQALKVLFETMFGPIDSGALGAAAAIEAFALKATLYALKVAIGLNYLESEFGLLSTAAGVVGAGMKAAFEVALLPIKAAIAAAGALHDILTKIGKATGTIGEGVAATVGQKPPTFEAGTKAADAQKAGMVEAGANAGKGYAEGLKAQASVVSATAKILGLSAQEALKLVNDSHSPSKKFMKEGQWAGEGYSLGIESMAPAVNDSIATMVEGDPDALSNVPMPEVTAAVASTPSKGGGNTFTFNITINASGGDADSIRTAVEEAITDILERHVEQAGGSLERAA